MMSSPYYCPPAGATMGAAGPTLDGGGYVGPVNPQGVPANQAMPPAAMPTPATPGTVPLTVPPGFPPMTPGTLPPAAPGTPPGAMLAPVQQPGGPRYVTPQGVPLMPVPNQAPLTGLGNNGFPLVKKNGEPTIFNAPGTTPPQASQAVNPVQPAGSAEPASNPDTAKEGKPWTVLPK